MAFPGRLARTVLLLAGLLAAPARADETEERRLIEGFFATIALCDLLEFSADGYLNELEPAYPVLDPGSIGQILDYTEAAFHRPRAPAMTRPYRPGEYPHLKWPMNRQFREQLAAFGQAMRAAGVPQLRTRTLVDYATHYLDLGLRAGYGDCYKISQVTGTSNFKEYVQVIMLAPEAQARIDGLFADRTASDFTDRERALLSQGVVTLDEAHELRALRLATLVFEGNTVLRHDMGAYPGNADYFGRVRTTCRAEMQTYHFFMRRLQRRGLLRHFTPEETWSYRPNSIPIDGHDGTIFRSLRTGELFVLDSWILDGGHPANILLLTDWLAKRDWV